MRSICAALSACAAISCSERPSPRALPAGDAARGREVIAAHQCGVCHEIPGVAGARGIVGPPLGAFAQRTFIAGRIANTSDNLVRWIEDPPAIDPETAMPALGVGERDARDIAAYLYQLD
jgi:cytochrome c2